MKKNIKFLFLWLAFGATELAAQNGFPFCDTCTYTYSKDIRPKLVDTAKTLLPKSNQEFVGCPNDLADSLRYKNIGFIHGLGGSSASWSKPAVWTGENFKTAKTVINYDALLQHSFNYICDDMIQPQLKLGGEQVSDNFPGRCILDDFVIAHSQGGIAARFLDRQWDVNQNGDFGKRTYFGLVTFGTPHAGADIALTKSQHNAFVQQIAGAIFLEKTYGVIFDFTQSFVGAFLGLKGSDVISKIDTAIKNKLAPLSFGSLHTPTLDEMKPNSTTMKEINAHKSKLRKVAFYGVEDAPECWKIMSNMTDTAAADYPLWGAKRDHHFQRKMEKVRHAHEAAIVEKNLKKKKLLRRKAAFNVFFPLHSLIWINGVIRQQVKEVEDENKHRSEAINFLNNANTHWRYLIGAYHKDSLETKTINKYIVSWQEKYGRLSRWYSQKRTFYNVDEAISYKNTRKNSVFKVRKEKLEIAQETRQVQLLFPNDGVVLVRSQIAFPGVGDRKDKMEGDNHFQERNSLETLRVLKRLYLGGSQGYYDSFFATPRL